MQITEPRSKCIGSLTHLREGCYLPKGAPSGRLTPSNSASSTALTSSPLSLPSPTTYASAGGETEQAYLDRIKAREAISEALLQVTRLKPDNPIDFLYNYFESQCHTDPYEKALTRLRFADPKHPLFESLLTELYANFNTLNDDALLLKGDIYHKLLENLCNNQLWSGSKEHRTKLLSLINLRPNDAVSFNVFKYGIQAVLLAKEFDKLARSLYASLARHAGTSMDIDRSLCEILLQMLTNSLSVLGHSPNDAFSLHESVAKLSPHHVKQTLEQRWSPSRSAPSSSSISKNRITMSALSDKDEVPLDIDDYDYAGDDNDDINNGRVEMDDGAQDSNDDDEEEEVVRHRFANRNKSHASSNDETNLIDYVIEEEKEIGGMKGDDSYLTSRSTTYSSLISADEEEEEEDAQSTGNETVATTKPKITAKEEGQMIRARAFLNRLDIKVQEKDDAVKRIRESIYLTKEKIGKMEQNKNQLEDNIGRAQDQQNVTIVNRLRSELIRVEREIALEQGVLKDLQGKLDGAEMGRTRAIVERGRYNAEDSTLKEKESILSEQKHSLVQTRKRQEDWKVTQMKRAHLSTLNTQKQALEQQAAAQRSAIDEARRSKKLAHKYLQQTFEKVRTEKRNEEEASRAETERKITSLLNLRNAIERNKDALSIKLAQKRAQERDMRDAQQREQQAVEDEGQNGLFYMLRKQRNEKLEQMQKRFSEQQEQNRLVIVEKILKEENEKERKRKLYPEFYKTNTKPSNTLTRSKEASQTSQSQAQSLVETESGIAQIVPTSLLDVDPIEYASSMTSAFQHDEFDDDMDVDLAQPEFNGLWDKQPAKPEIDPLFNRSKHWKTKMDQDILQRTLARLKENVVREQVVGSKRYEGSMPFKSDPTEIYFKDFDVGKVYRTRVTLTNVTLTINTLKLVDLSESLKDFITLKFEPPGMISAGMSCYLHVTFEPKINENLRGEIKFLAQTGMFTVPIRCEIKKVELSLDKTTVNVGTTVVDERLHQSITLRNNGGLGTNYRLVKSSLHRAEQVENQQEQSKSKQATPPSEKETDSGAEVTDLVQKEYVDVFTIKGDARGFLAPHSSISFPIEFSAPVASTFQEQYTLVFDQNHPELTFSINAQSIDVPVWIENPSTDFKICMFDRLYQDALVLRNRSSAALRVSVEIQPRTLQNHIEIVPRTAYIQAKSSFSLQIKLIARPSIVDDELPLEIFDPTYNTLIVPLEIKVADQIRTVPFSISAVLTTSDLQFDVEHIDFGCCTTTESVVAKIHLKNNSLLAQPFGFVNLPDYIQVQPNDGFGTLLPEETIPLHVLFSPSATKEHRCTLTCKSLVNREFTIHCQGVGVLPPLVLSSTVIHFPATPINDQSIATFYVENRHLDKNHFRHPVPRIGNGEFAPVGPTSFQFDVPENAPITISPLVGTVEPGTRQKITVRLAPRVDPNDIRAESIRIKEAELKRQMDGKDSPHKSESKSKPPGTGGTSTRRRDTTGSSNSDNISPAPEHSNDWSIAQLSVMKSLPSSIGSFLIPCYVASGECLRPGLLNYDMANTLFLQVHCPIVRPELIVISDYGQTTIDFGSASLGQELSRTVLIQNITKKSIQLHSTLLNIDGPFRLLNALRKVEPGGTTPIKLTFTPNVTMEFLETLELSSDSSKLTLCLKGVGLKPDVQLSFDTSNPFFMGCVLAKDHVEKSFQIINHSETQVTFKVDLASQHVDNRIEQENKNVWGATFNSNKHMIGPQNLSGRSVFDITPLNGVIPAGGKKQLTVIFSPEHDSDFFSDFVRVTISDQPVKLEFRLRGSGRQNTMFIRPLDNANVIQKSLLPSINDAVTAQMQATDPNEKAMPNNIVVLLSAQMVQGKYVSAQRELMIGCAAVSSGSKRNGDYSFDNLKDINTEGFNVDNPKSSVESGTEKAVKITWTPPSNFDVNEACRATATVTTKGDVTRTWRVILVGYVDSASLSDKRPSRPAKNHPTMTNRTRSIASPTGTSQQFTLQESIHEND